jgi:L-arabinose transport system ATP-binding protein
VHSVRDNINISARRKHIVLGALSITVGSDQRRSPYPIVKYQNAGSAAVDHESLRGNQQEAILGRWLSEDMKVILLDEPTRGIDVGAA